MRNMHVFLTSSEKSSFEDTVQKVLEPGIFDYELGNSVLLALTNALKIPIVFSSINSYPVIPLIPRVSPLISVPLYAAFNQSGKGHYDPVFPKECGMPRNKQGKSKHIQDTFSFMQKRGCKR